MKQLNLSWTDVENHMHEILRKIHLDNFRPDYVVGIVRGGLVPAVQISHYLKVPLYTQKICLRDGGDVEHAGWTAEEAFGVFQQGMGYEGKKSLVVDDINDSGATFEWLKKDWESGCHPNNRERWQEIWHKSVRFAALIDNIQSPFSVDYASKEINKAEEDVWINFPWECWWT